MKAGFIGLGHIGRGMAKELVEAGLDTAVYDLFPEGPAELAALGAKAVGSPAEVAAHADVVGICVRTDQDVFDVVRGDQGLLAGAKPGLILAIHSTVRPSTVHTVAKEAAEKGVRVIDAPVSRGTPNDKGKTIIFMLGGEAKDIADARPFIEAGAKDVIEAGALGAAMALKICNNLVTYTEFMAGFEAHSLALRTGLDPALLLQVMTSNGNATPSMQFVMQSRIANPGEPDGPTRAHGEQFTAIGQKDLDCALEVAAELGLNMQGTQAARQAIRDIFLGSVESGRTA